MNEVKLIPISERPETLKDFRQEMIMDRYVEFKDQVERGVYNEDVIFGFETALIILGYKIKGVE